MADLLDDPAFWLPTQILDDDDDDDDDDLPAMDPKAQTNSKTHKSTMGFDFDTTEATKAMFPFEFPYGGVYGGSFGVSSDLSSPVESVVGSSEAESDEEDYLAELTRQMARSTLDNELNHSDSAVASENPKSWVVSGSPQSTLCAVESGCGCGHGSSRGSPNAQSMTAATWDLLHAAAGEVAKMRVNQSRGVLGPPRNPSPVSVSNPSSNHPDVGFYLQQQSLSHKHLQATQFRRLKQQQMMKEQRIGVWGAQSPCPHQQSQMRVATQSETDSFVQPRGSNNTLNTLNNKALGLSLSAWPPVQQAEQQRHYQKSGPGLTVRAVNPSAKKECAGTGVFLPRQNGNPSETRKKPGCSTAFVPARVVRALKLNIDDLCSQQQQPQLHRALNGRYNPDYEFALRLRSTNSNNAAVSQQKRSMRPHQLPQMNNEIRLPQEWTY